jgi:ataxin-10
MTLRLEEVTTPHQTTLLKLLDSYLQSSDNADPATLYPEIVPLLRDEFLTLSARAQASIQLSMGSVHDAASAETSTSTLVQAPDALVPKVLEALVLVTQCLTTICLHFDQGKLPKPAIQKLRSQIHAAQSGNGQGVVESLVGG